MVDTPADSFRPRADAANRQRWLALTVVLALVLVVVVVAGSTVVRSSGGKRLAVDDDISIGFARDMSVHHAQAVAMSRYAHRRAADPDLAYLAFDILTTQQGQIGSMHGWLELWDQPRGVPVGKSMTWMPEHKGGAMPGMATSAEVVALETLPVAVMEERFLRLMIRHHHGALAMAELAAERAGSESIRVLAAKMSAGQQSEIEAMQAILAKRGLSREPLEPAAHGAGQH